MSEAEEKEFRYQMLVLQSENFYLKRDLKEVRKRRTMAEKKLRALQRKILGVCEQ